MSASTPEATTAVPTPAETASRPGPSDTEIQRANWASESRVWSWIRARAIEHRHESSRSNSGTGSDLPTTHDHEATDTPAAITPVVTPRKAVSQPSRLDIESQRIDWTHERLIWSSICAQAAERYRQFQLEREKEGRGQGAQEHAQAEYEQARNEDVSSTTEPHQQLRLERENRQDDAICLRVLQRRQDFRGKAQAQYEAEKARTAREAKRASSLARYKRLWSISLSGLIVSGVLFIILFTNVLRAPKGGWPGVEATSNVAPSITDGSIFSVVCWIAVIMDIASVPAALLAAANVAKLNEADATYWHSLYTWSVTGICVGGLMALFPFAWALWSVVKGACEGGFCLKLGLATLAIISWTLLAFNACSLFLKIMYGA